MAARPAGVFRRKRTLRDNTPWKGSFFSVRSAGGGLRPALARGVFQARCQCGPVRQRRAGSACPVYCGQRCGWPLAALAKALLCGRFCRLRREDVLFVRRTNIAGRKCHPQSGAFCGAFAAGHAWPYTRFWGCAHPPFSAQIHLVLLDVPNFRLKA